MPGASNGRREGDHGRGGGEGQILEGGVSLRPGLEYHSHRIFLHIRPLFTYEIITHNDEKTLEPPKIPEQSLAPSRGHSTQSNCLVVFLRHQSLLALFVQMVRQLCYANPPKHGILYYHRQMPFHAWIPALGTEICRPFVLE